MPGQRLSPVAVHGTRARYVSSQWTSRRVLYQQANTDYEAARRRRAAFAMLLPELLDEPGPALSASRKMGVSGSGTVAQTRRARKAIYDRARSARLAESA
jgi:hypothetical protein